MDFRHIFRKINWKCCIFSTVDLVLGIQELNINNVTEVFILKNNTH